MAAKPYKFTAPRRALVLQAIAEGKTRTAATRREGAVTDMWECVCCGLLTKTNLVLAYTDSIRPAEGRRPLLQGRSETHRDGNECMADTDSKRNDGRKEIEVRGIQTCWPGSHVSDFPPAPNDLEGWERVLAEVPSLEPAFCRVADGVAWRVDATADRTHRLRVLGNGVVPLVAAHALRTLCSSSCLTSCCPTTRLWERKGRRCE